MHIHHVVPGVVLTVVGGFGALASRQGLGTGVFAVVFGVGAGLVLDEFALILHLADVYWSEQGRKSVEVVVVTAAMVGLVLAGFSPFGVDDLSADELQDRGAVIASVVLNFVFSLLALSKGKARTALFGVVVPVVALVGAVRLARTASPWARRFYRRRPRTRARAGLRACRHESALGRARPQISGLDRGQARPAAEPGGRPPFLTQCRNPQTISTRRSRRCAPCPRGSASARVPRSSPRSPGLP